MSRFSIVARAILWIAGTAAAGTAMLLASAFLYLSPDLPSVDALRDMRLQTPLRVYTADGALIGEFGEQRRTPIRFEDVPPLFIDAVLAAEDHGFYQHHGVDFSGLLRAASQLVTTGRIQTGGSTITMQVARNYFLSHARTFSRKFNEILLALQIERELEKSEILELYVNKIFLGNRAYGIEAAAQVYYGKPIQELDLAQLTMIAGLPKAPSSNNPLANPERAIERRNWILGRMLELGYIDRNAHRQAVAQPVTASYHGPAVDLEAGYVAEMVRREMIERYGLAAYTDGYIAYATIDSGLQRTAQRAVVDGLLAYDQRHGYRGPEAHLENDLTTGHTQWRRQLQTFPPYGGLRAAVVVSVEERSFTAMFANGRQLEIGWEQGLGDIQPYLSVDSRGARPDRASDVLARGDVVRLRQAKPVEAGAEADWRLDQVPAVQAALVALDADTGAVRSLVGGFDFELSKFNRATQAQRQPGSAFKPFLYSAALEHGFTAASIINDAPVVFDDAQLESLWRPTNDSGKFYGPTRLRRALYLSRNLVSIRLLRSIGVNNARDYLQRFGFDPASLPKDLSLALGSNTVTPVTLANAFAVLANGGYRVEPHVLARVENLAGKVLFEPTVPVVCRDCLDLALNDIIAASDTPLPIDEAETATMADILSAAGPIPVTLPPPRAEQVMDPRVAFIIDSILRDVIKRGTGRKALVLKRDDLAGKTGTTNGPTDAWFSGYGGGLVTTAWVGFDQYQPLGRREYGGSAALPIWIDYMRTALENRPERVPRQPEGVVSIRIDPATGLRAHPGQDDAIFEYFRAENAPREMARDSAAEPNYPGGGSLGEEDIF